MSGRNIHAQAASMATKTAPKNKINPSMGGTLRCVFAVSEHYTSALFSILPKNIYDMQKIYRNRELSRHRTLSSRFTVVGFDEGFDEGFDDEGAGRR